MTLQAQHYQTVLLGWSWDSSLSIHTQTNRSLIDKLAYGSFPVPQNLIIWPGQAEEAAASLQGWVSAMGVSWEQKPAA